jgi:hypothetical protein
MSPSLRGARQHDEAISMFVALKNRWGFASASAEASADNSSAFGLLAMTVRFME